MSHKAHLEHALLSVRDCERTLRFYQTLLPDWVVRWQGEGADGHRWVHFGPEGPGQPGYLSLSENPQASPADDSEDVLSVRHLGFAHPDVDALARQAEAAGIEVTDRMDDGSYRRVYFLDPNGHEIEFVQAL